MKIGIVGAGAVGASCLLSTITRGFAREIVLVNRDRKKADGVVTDAQYGAVLYPGTELRAGDYGDLQGASLVMLTVGVNEKAGGATDRRDPAGRLRLLDKNADVYREVVPQIRRAAADSVLLVVTDPPDPLADVARVLGFQRAVSTGTFLDSLRFRHHLARRLEVDATSVDAMVLGEHGTSSVFVWSSARVGGRRVTELLDDAARQDIEKEVRYANITIIEGIGASQYGIGMVCARIAEMVARDERSVVPIGSFSEKYQATLSLPSVVGSNGVERVLEPELTDAEQQALEHSAGVLREAAARATRDPGGKAA